ncbi:hypothetical protein D4A92_20575 [Rhizobium rosettiformans]|uniref:Pentapeptide repeat-containing protein n=1 Tax=Rhizobium rosettiformans TaxID=1368430 RepID=A0ABX7F0F5_9HYPH|nr:pentapeptide repeat-containing protein [Rhizobium rosettiformans]QRF53675.1 hypothetical protein D4A92_20575 [Rhizobium rosettiformans]
MKNAKFYHCRFVDCIFSGCYMKDSEFVHCEFVGCHFEICTTTGIVLKDSTIEHAEFLRCVIPYDQLSAAMTDKHSANDVMLLNCAAEAHRIARWREAPQFLIGHNIEKRKFWRKMIIAEDPYYKKYSFLSRARAFFRLIVSSAGSVVFGDVTSIFRLFVVGFFLIFIICPSVIVFLDENSSVNGESGLYVYIKYYFSYLYTSINLAIGTALKAEYDPAIEYREMVELGFRVFVVLYLAILANFLTKLMGRGPKW